MMHPNALYGPEVRQKIADLYTSGVEILEIGAQTGASPHTVTTIAREMGCKLRAPGIGPNTWANKHRDRLERAIVRYQKTEETIDAICSEEGISRNWLLEEVTARGLPRRNQSIDCCEAAKLRRTYRCNEVAQILDASHQGVGRAIERHKMLLDMGVPPERHGEMKWCTRAQIRERMSRSEAAE